MSLRLSSNQSSHFVSLWSGLGIPGAEVPTDGDNGGSPLTNDGISPTAEYRIETVSAPSAGTLTVFPDTSYEFSGAPDDSYEWQYRLYEDSVDRGTAIEYLIVGSPVAVINATTALPVFSGSASVLGYSPDFAITASTAFPTFSGGAYVSPVVVFNVTTELPTFIGSALVSGVSASISAITTLPSFVGYVNVLPVAAILSNTSLPIFYGSASGIEDAYYTIDHEYNVLSVNYTYNQSIIDPEYWN